MWERLSVRFKSWKWWAALVPTVVLELVGYLGDAAQYALQFLEDWVWGE